jgi:cob(I)alamin adenosyltransferase
MSKEKLGLVHVYTGDGKGKTTASMGLAMRAIGQGFNVQVFQFLKGGTYTGELVTGSDHLPRTSFIQSGKGCLKIQKQMKLGRFANGREVAINIRGDSSCGSCRHCFEMDEDEEKNTRRAFNQAFELARTGDVDILILDEINCVMKVGIIPVEDVLKLINEKHPNTELILTGRHAPEVILEAADLVTRMECVKHPYQKGIEARRGIEF